MHSSILASAVPLTFASHVFAHLASEKPASFEKMLYSFTPPVMPKEERIGQTILFGILLIVAIVILSLTCVAYWFKRRRDMRLEEMDALRGDREARPQMSSRALPASQKNQRPKMEQKATEPFDEDDDEF